MGNDLRYRDRDWLHRQYITNGKNGIEISKMCGCNQSVIYDWLKKHGIESSPMAHRDQWGEKNPAWKGGRVGRAGRYISIYSPNHPHADGKRYILEHRLVMEKHLGRYLKTHEIVHHMDGNRSNNDISNLELTTKKTHRVGYRNGYVDGYLDSALEILACAVVENL